MVSSQLRLIRLFGLRAVDLVDLWDLEHNTGLIHFLENLSAILVHSLCLRTTGRDTSIRGKIQKSL